MVYNISIMFAVFCAVNTNSIFALGTGGTASAHLYPLHSLCTSLPSAQPLHFFTLYINFQQMKTHI
jgi:hypothetical protein